MGLADKLNPALRDLPVYQPGRPLDEVAREIGSSSDQLIKLASNENPLGPSPKAIAAMENAASEMNRYPDGNVFYLRKQLSKKLDLQPNNLVFGNGSNEIIEFVAHSLLGPDNQIVVSQYCFAIYPIVAKMMGATVVEVPARNLGHDLPAMLKAVTPKTRIVFVANPNNPTGTITTQEEVNHLISELPDDILLVMDEAYIEYQEDAIDLLPRIRSGEYPNLLLMRTFSKIYGLAGLRVGYGIGHSDFVGSLEKVRQPFNLNAMAQTAAMAAINDDDHLNMSRKQNQKGSIFLEDALNRAGILCLQTAANFILIQVGDAARVTEDLKQFGVIVRPMGGYGLPEWIRVTIGTDEENERLQQGICQALERPMD